MVVEKAGTINCVNCNQMIFAKEYQEELPENAGLCWDCQEAISRTLILMEKHHSINQKINKAIKASGSRKSIVIYRAYIEDTQQMPIDNLDQVAVQGKVRFASSASVYGRQLTEKDYLSKIVVNPTWLQVAIFANEMLEKTNQRERICLEDVVVVRQDYGVKKAVFSMGYK